MMVAPHNRNTLSSTLADRYWRDDLGMQGHVPTRAQFDIHARRYAWNCDARLRSVPRDQPVLDIGCGAGEFLFYLHEAGFRDLRGIDLGAEQIATARRFFEDETTESRPSLEQANAYEYLAEQGDTFALIAMNDVLEHVEPAEVVSLLERARDALREGGCLLIKTPNMDNPLALSYRYRDFTHTCGFTTRSLGFVLRAAGFGRMELVGEDAPTATWRQRVRRRLLRGSAERLLRLAFYAFEMGPVPDILSPVLLAFAYEEESPSQSSDIAPSSALNLSGREVSK